MQGKECHSKHIIIPGLDRLSALIKKWIAEPSTYSPTEMRGCLDSWREVLFTHLDQEVIISLFVDFDRPAEASAMVN